EVRYCNHLTMWCVYPNIVSAHSLCHATLASDIRLIWGPAGQQMKERTDMRLGAIPQNITESIGLATGSVPTPLMDTLVALLLARTIMTAASVGIFQALDSQPLTADEIAKRCETDPQATKRLIRALFGCKYLKYKNDRFAMASVTRRWLSPNSPCSLHSAVLHCHLDLHFMNFEEYVRHGSCRHFHS